MPYIDDDDVRRVREATDLVALVSERVVLRQKGRLFWGCCPFHDEKTPSFKIDPDTQLWHCFGCGKGGDVFGYLMESERYEFPDAVRALAERAHIDIHETGGRSLPRGKKERLMSACKAAEDFFSNELLRSRAAGPASARSYLSGRGFDINCAKKWKLGYAPGRGQLVQHLMREQFTRNEIVEANLAYVNDRGRLIDRFYERVMFPVHDEQGRTIAFGGRVIGQGEPKYLNSSETPVFHKSSHMFGLDMAKSACVNSGQAVVVEGYTDVIALHEAGMENVVATLGTALTAQHIKTLTRFARKIVFLFDGDAAGQKAAMRASEFIDWHSALESRRDPVDLRVVVLPDNNDPAEFVAAKGVDALRELVDQSEPLLRFAIERCLASYDLRKPEQKARALQQSLQILLPLRGSVSATDYENLIADYLNLEYTSVAKAFREIKAPMAARHQNDTANSEPEPQRTSAVVREIIEADQELVQKEHELISLFVETPRLLDYLEKDLARIAWQDTASEQMAAALLAVDHDAGPGDALMAVQAACPQAPSLLSAAMTEVEGDAERLYQARVMIRSLRIRDLEREVKAARARMSGETDFAPGEFDALFDRTIQLQREIARLRNESDSKFE